ncbi:MAG: hypothetical protein HC845_05350 [Akkermansiaceae bacterium]|nr:hypothetical protein [Akkermansiaceae bacterium]
MQLPEESAKKLQYALISKSLLEKPAIDEVIKSLETEKPVNWNLILTKQFEIEQGGHREAES